MSKPNFLICGAQKSGTSSLRSYLYQHPEIFMTIREMHFFSRNYDKSTSWYESFFDTDKKVVGEKSISYISDPNAPGRIFSYDSKMKLIFLLRNPVDRAYSEYSMNISTMRAHKTIEEEIKSNPGMFTRGLYAMQLKRFNKFFPEKQMLIIISEDFKKNKLEILKNVYNFLRVDEGFVPGDLEDKNVGVYTKSRSVRFIVGIHDRFIGNTNNRILKIISEGSRRRLAKKRDKLSMIAGRDKIREYYVDSNKELEKMLGVKLRWD